MDSMRNFGSDFGDSGDDRDDDQGMEAPPQIATDERRMHVRAYNFWAQMLADRAYPAIDDLDIANLSDFGPHAVLLDFTAGIENPAIAFLGDTLREECSLAEDVASIDQVPSRSLLSRLTDHYMQIIANQAPIGFEAEFVNDRGLNILYRGILLPFSSDDDTIDFILGVMNWKQVADDTTTQQLQAEVENALRRASPLSAVVPGWADGPEARPIEDGAGIGDRRGLSADVPTEDGADAMPDEDAGLADWLSVARESAHIASHAHVRSRSALYGAISKAYDFSLVAEHRPDDYRDLLDDAGLTMQDRAPMTPVVKLVFGADYDKTRLAEYAAALTHGRERGIARGALRSYLDSYDGGLKGLVRDIRASRRSSGPSAAEKLADARAALRSAQAIGYADYDVADRDGEFFVMIGRRCDDGKVAIVAAAEDEALLNRALVKAKTVS